MDFGLYTSKSKTVGSTVKDVNSVVAQDILNPQEDKNLEGTVDFVHMILSKKFDDDEFVLNGFYVAGKKQDPTSISFYDIVANSNLEIENSEAVRLYNSYINQFYSSKN